MFVDYTLSISFQGGEYMGSQLPISVDLRITGRCNLKCMYCFGASNEAKELDLNMWIKILDLLHQNQVQYVVITGGEPTLYPDLLILLKYAKKIGFKIVLSSNGLNNDLLRYCKYVDVLSLPLDGDNYLHCKSLRGMSYNQYLQLLNNIMLFKKTYPEKRLKIGTVVTQINISYINNIYRIIRNYADIWKLYQVSEHPRNVNIYKSKLAVSDEDFDTLVNYIKSQVSNNMNVISYSNYNRSGKYLFCEPNGDAMVIFNGAETIIGNFFTGFDSVLNKWYKYVNYGLLEQNIIETYFY